MHKQLILMQGVPGSGKTTAAKRLIYEFERPPYKGVVCSADHYFMRDGRYQFDPAKLGDAHAACFRSALELMMRPPDHSDETLVVVIDNTNITWAEMNPYYLAAQAFEFDEVLLYRVQVDPAVAHARNIHGVPLEVIQRMAERMEDPPPFAKITPTAQNC